MIVELVEQYSAQVSYLFSFKYSCLRSIRALAIANVLKNLLDVYDFYRNIARDS